MSDAEELKKRFKQGAVPDESDYATLITLANPATGIGLELVAGKLNVRPGVGISADETGVSLNVDRTTLDVTGGVLGVKLLEGGNSGLDSAGGLHVKTGPGLKADAAGLGLDLAENSGLAHDKQVEGRWPLYVNVDENTSGLEFDKTSHKLQVKVPKDAKNYLVMGADGLSLTDQGIANMKTALETVTSEALEKAKANTVSGTQKDMSVAPATMEGQIAAALNTAYQEGWMLTRARTALQKGLSDWKAAGQLKPENFFKESGVFLSTAWKGGYMDMFSNVFGVDGTPVIFEGDCLYILRMNDKGTAEVFPCPKEKHNLTNFENGIYAIVGKVNEGGLPSASGPCYTRYAMMAVQYGSGIAIAGNWDLSVDPLKWEPHPLDNPWTWSKNRPRAEQTHLVFPLGTKEINVMSSFGVVPHDASDKIYFVAGDKTNWWGTVVQKLTPEGVLTMTGENCNINILAVEMSYNPSIPVDLRVEVRNNKFAIKSAIVLAFNAAGLNLTEAILGHEGYVAGSAKITAVDTTRTDFTLKDNILVSKDVIPAVKLNVSAEEEESGRVLTGQCTLDFISPSATLLRDTSRIWQTIALEHQGDAWTLTLTPVKVGVPLTYFEPTGQYRITETSHKFFLPGSEIPLEFSLVGQCRLLVENQYMFGKFRIDNANVKDSFDFLLIDEKTYEGDKKGTSCTISASEYQWNNHVEITLPDKSKINATVVVK